MAGNKRRAARPEGITGAAAVQGVPGMIIRYHFIMPCLPISAGTPKSMLSLCHHSCRHSINEVINSELMIEKQ